MIRLSSLLQLVGAEVRRHARTRWFAIGAIALVALGWAVIGLGVRDDAEQHEAYAESLQARLQVQLKTSQASGRAAEPGLRVLRPPNAGAILVQGQDRSFPAAWELTPAGPEALPAYSATGRRLEGGGAWDIDMLVRLVGAVLAMVLGLGSVLSDRATGWIESLRSLPLSRGTAGLARLVGGAGALLALVVLWWLTMSAALLVSGSSRQLLGRLWLLAPTVLIQLWIYFGLGVVFAWRMKSSVSAIALAVGVWLGTAVLGPSLVSLIAQLGRPVTTANQMERERREQFSDAMRLAETEVAQQLASKLSGVREADYGDVGNRAFVPLEPVWQDRIHDVRSRVTELEDAWRTQQETQQRLVAQLSWLFPGALGRDVLAELAGTGRDGVLQWERAVAAYQAQLNGRLFDNRPLVNLRVSVGGRPYPMAFARHPAPEFRDLPRFEPPAATWRTRAVSAAPAMIGLVVWLIVVAGAAYRSDFTAAP